MRGDLYRKIRVERTFSRTYIPGTLLDWSGSLSQGFFQAPITLDTNLHQLIMTIRQLNNYCFCCWIAKATLVLLDYHLGLGIQIGTHAKWLPCRSICLLIWWRGCKTNRTSVLSGLAGNGRQSISLYIHTKCTHGNEPSSSLFLFTKTMASVLATDSTWRDLQQRAISKITLISHVNLLLTFWPESGIDHSILRYSQPAFSELTWLYVAPSTLETLPIRHGSLNRVSTRLDEGSESFQCLRDSDNSTTLYRSEVR